MNFDYFRLLSTRDRTRTIASPGIKLNLVHCEEIGCKGD